MTWKGIRKESLTVGQKVTIRPQGLYGFAPIYTPRWASGITGTVIRINEKTITVDVGDGGKPIRVDLDDCGYFMN